eukprot:PhM_4_TR532/c0_g1_i1/m.89177/K10771/APEX1; AP endonuclease 1
MPPKKRVKEEDTAEEGNDNVTNTRKKAAAPKLAREATVTEDSILENTIPFVRLTKDTDYDKDKMMKVITWNVDGLRAVVNKHEKAILDLFKTEEPDVLCMQETKLQADNTKFAMIPGYDVYDSCDSVNKGRSGTRIYVKKGIEHTVTYGFDANEKHEIEGRVMIVDTPTCAVVNTYVPNSGMNLERLGFRTKTWDASLRKCIAALQEKGKQVVWTGDLNVAERDYDRFFSSNFKQMQKSPGFTPEERASFRVTLSQNNLVDSFRELYPKAAHVYSYWSVRGDLKSKNKGWRLDYFVLSKALMAKVVDTFMMSNVAGSDHCPCVLWLKKQ